MADDDEHEYEPTMRLFVARWPDGTAMIISAESMSEVAGRLDEVGDPGACEVVPLDGPIAIVARPRSEPPGELWLDVSLDALDDALDVQRAIMAAAFPALHELIEQRRGEDGGVDVDRAAWSAAVAREGARKLAPTALWANAIKEWWEETCGASADRSAALRERMRVTIPGEPVPSPTMRALFEAEHRRIQQRIEAALGVGAADEQKTARPAKGPKKSAAKPKSKAQEKPAKKKPPRGSNSGRSVRRK
jgi:hypothetical protein